MRFLNKILQLRTMVLETKQSNNMNIAYLLVAPSALLDRGSQQLSIPSSWGSFWMQPKFVSLQPHEGTSEPEIRQVILT